MKMFRQAMIVFFKEIKCIIRDKKTFIFGLLLPLILVPSMLFIIDFSMKNVQNQSLTNVNVGMSDYENSFYNFLKAQDGVTITDVDNPQKALDSGVICAYINIDKDMDNKIIKKEDFNLDIKYGDSSINSMMSTSTVMQYQSAYKYLISNYEFKSVEELRDLMNFKIELNQNGDEVPNLDMSSLYFSMLVPTMLILYCCMGSSGTAADMSAGEKERGTLEPLLSTCADRSGIVIGKLLATTAMGVASGVFTVLGLWGYLLISSGASSHKISVLGMILLLVITLFISMTFSAINLMIGVYAKSYKEAQTYLMPVSLLCSIPSFFTYALDINSIGILEMCIPVFNMVCIIKEVLAGVFNSAHLLTVFFWLLIYISISVWLTLRMFKKESVVFRI